MPEVAEGNECDMISTGRQGTFSSLSTKRHKRISKGTFPIVHVDTIAIVTRGIEKWHVYALQVFRPLKIIWEGLHL